MGSKAQNISNPSCGQMLHRVCLGLTVNSSWQICEKTRPGARPTGPLESHCRIKGSIARNTHRSVLFSNCGKEGAKLQSPLRLLSGPRFLNNHLGVSMSTDSLPSSQPPQGPFNASLSSTSVPSLSLLAIVQTTVPKIRTKC